MSLSTLFFSDDFVSSALTVLSARTGPYNIIGESGTTRELRLNDSPGSPSLNYPTNADYGTTGNKTLYLAGTAAGHADAKVSVAMQSDGSDNGGTIYLLLRGSGTTEANSVAYAAKLAKTLGSLVISCQIVRIAAGGGQTNIGTAANFTSTTSVNFTTEFSVVGTALTLKINGTTITSGTDSTITAAGRCGLGAEKSAGSTSGHGMPIKTSFAAYHEAVSDAVPPTMTGSLSSSSVLTTSYTLSWSAATDAVGVTGYEGSTDNGSTYVDWGLVLTKNVTGATASTLYHTKVRAYDAAGNKATPLSLDVTTATPNAAPTFTGAVSNITGTGGVAISTQDVSALFSDTGDTKTYSASPSGTAWPTGLVIDSSTGVISGTVATSTTTGLKVRDTDSVGQTVDSNAFSVTISAPGSTVATVTVSPSSATVVGGTTKAFSAVVNGTGSPSQTVNWSTSLGSITTGGVLTAVAATTNAQTVTVTATSAQDGTKNGTATVTIPAIAAITVTSPSAGGKKIFDGSARASVACHVTMHNKASRALLATKTGLTSGPDGVVTFTTTALTAGIEYLFIVSSDADDKDIGRFFATPV